MSFAGNLIISTYSIALLIFILLHALEQTEKKSLQNRLFMRMIQVTMAMLVVDIFSRFDGHPGTIYPVLNYLGNFLIYLLNPILPSLWLLYAHFQVFHNEKKMWRLMYPLLAINTVNAVLIIMSQPFGWYYYIDSGNIYHRGELFWLAAFITFALTFAALVLIIVKRKNIEKKYYFSLVFFPIPPFACVILQSFIYGIPLALNSVAFSLLVVFFNVQNHSIYIDYLTGAYNRKKLENYMEDKINTSTKNKTFSAILIDLDNFKSINDTCGHNVGDYVLETCVTLLKNCLRETDFIARFGGDEFYIILDISKMQDLEATVCRINSCLEIYNKQETRPYKLGFSMGYAVYDYQSHMNSEEFQKQIDQLMYENKRANKQM